MKKAFTLAEAVITIGIIGIIAALTLPMISHIRPNQNKILYLKTFDALQQAVISLASNTKEYPVCSGNTLFYSNNINVPLLNINNSYNGPNPSISSQRGWNNHNKLCNLLAWSMNGAGLNGAAICNNVMLALDTPGSGSIFNANGRFYTPNGVEFVIRTRNAGANRYSVNVRIDVNGNNQPNCLYNFNNPNACPNPDRFWFMITADGRVIPADPMGRAYVQTRNSNSVKNMQDYIRQNIITAADPDGYLRWTNDAADGDGTVTDRAVTDVCR